MIKTIYTIEISYANEKQHTNERFLDEILKNYEIALMAHNKLNTVKISKNSIF